MEIMDERNMQVYLLIEMNSQFRSVNHIRKKLDKSSCNFQD